MSNENGSFEQTMRRHIPKFVLLVVVILFCLLTAFRTVYSVGEQEQAVVITFGSPKLVSETGLHFKIPWLQDVRLVSTMTNGMAIGYDQETREAIEMESLMITKDYNFVNVDFYIEYRVSDPIDYLYASRQPTQVLKTLAQSYIRDTIGLYPVDDIITTGKNEIQSEIKSKLSERLENENIGLQLMNITIQDAVPPTKDVQAAFKDVETAKQGKETSVNQANKYKSEQEPKAEANADEVVKQAEATATARKNEAVGQVARFNEMYKQYALNPLVTKQRMFYEAMEEILPGLKIVIDDGGNLNKVMPLGEFATTNIVTEAKEEAAAE